MKQLVLYLFALTLVSSGFGQNSPFDEEIFQTIYPEGIYRDFESFLKRVPTNEVSVEQRDLYKPKQRIMDLNIDNCYFYYKRKGKRVKDAFAISYKGRLFIRVRGMIDHVNKKDKKQKIEYKDSFLNVLDLGRYLYMEGYFRKGGGGLGLSIGVGNVGVGTGGPKEKPKGIIFDFDKGEFDIIQDCKDFNRFLEINHPEEVMVCNNKEVPLILVRKIIRELNNPAH